MCWHFAWWDAHVVGRDRRPEVEGHRSHCGYYLIRASWERDLREGGRSSGPRRWTNCWNDQSLIPSFPPSALPLFLLVSDSSFLPTTLDATGTHLSLPTPVPGNQIGVQSFPFSVRTDSPHPVHKTPHYRPRIDSILPPFLLAANGDSSKIDASLVKKVYERIAPGLLDRWDVSRTLPSLAPRPCLVLNGELDGRNWVEGIDGTVSLGSWSEAVPTMIAESDEFCPHPSSLPPSLVSRFSVVVSCSLAPPRPLA